MAVTGSQPLRAEEVQQQVERVLNSSVLQSSESLRRLLRYLADQAQLHPGSSLKEFQIAMDVFGRSSDFDPRLDSTVRVQTGRLRNKLAEYYANAGLADELIVEIPKGSYALSVHPRVVAVASPADTALPETAAAPVVAVAPAARNSNFGTGVAIAALAVTTVLSTTTAAMLWTTRRPAAAVSAAAQPRTPPLAPVLSAFWRPFTETGDAPIVIFSNAEFTGRPETGMHYFVRGKDKPGEILDHYTGVGEVLAVGELTRIFGRLNSAVRVKRGRLLSLDDARNNDIILLGSPAENPVLRDLHPNRHFVFSPSAGPARKGDLAIRNVNPKDGEPREFLASAGLPIQEDYALVALHPGLTERKWILALAGTTTFGTQAAAEFVSHADSVQELLTRTGTPAGASPSPFEAVVQIEIAGGVPVKTRIVAIRQR